MKVKMSNDKVVDMLSGKDLSTRKKPIVGRATTTLNEHPIQAFFTKNFYMYFNDHWYNGYIEHPDGAHPDVRKYIENGGGFTTAKPVTITPVDESTIPDIDYKGSNDSEETLQYESDLQASMVSQINELFPEYKIIGENNEGVEYEIGGKKIDILLEKNNGDLLVIELKPGIADYEVFGQISMYIGLLMEKFPERVIKGFVIAGEMDASLKYAIKTTDNIGLKTYKIKSESESESELELELELNDE